MVTNLTLARIATARPRPTPRPEPLPFNNQHTEMSGTEEILRIRNRDEVKTCNAYLNSCLQAFEHWRIFQHIRNDHKSVMKIIYIKVH